VCAIAGRDFMDLKVRGSHPWALILCNAKDRPAPNWPERDYFDALIASPDAGGLYTWWRDISSGNLDFAGSNVFGWYRLPFSVAKIQKMERGPLVAAARKAATSKGVDLSGYLHTVAIVTYYLKNGNEGSDVAYGINSTNGQPGWRWCANCAGIAYWDGTSPPGACNAGQRHDHSDSSYYSLPHDSAFPGGEEGWRWCDKCQALIFLTPTAAPCPGGGTHALGRTNYVLRKNRQQADEQRGWRRCNACQALATLDHLGQRGSCPLTADHHHDYTGSGNYSIPFAWAADLGFLAHETGHGFGLDHAFGTSRDGDRVNDSRPGAYGDWTDVMSWGRTASFAAPRFTPAGAGLSAPTLYKLGWLSDADATTVEYASAAQTLTLRPLHSFGMPLTPTSSSAQTGSLSGAGGTGGTQRAPVTTVRMIRVVEPAQGRIYTAEYRKASGWDRGIKTSRVVVHAMRSLYQVGQDGWRWCRNCEGMIYAADTACPAGGVHDGGGSAAYWLSVDAPPSGEQSDWRWCAKCSGLFFDGDASKGACPRGDVHDGSASGAYALPSSGSGQSNWRWCNKCQGLAFGGTSSPGVCPAGGLHDHAGSGNYVLRTRSGSHRQDKWRRCAKCQGLYYAAVGACKGGPVHLFGGEDYALVHDLAGAAGQPGWRYCFKCSALVFSDESRAEEGACAAGGVHDLSASGNYVIPRDAETEVGQRRWFVCTKCSAVNYIDTSRGPGRCSAGGRHRRDRWEYLIEHDAEGRPQGGSFRWCRKCENMVLGSNPPRCVKGGNHDTSRSGTYLVRTDPASLNREQGFWRSCTNCSTLFALKSDDGTKESPCAAGGIHSPAGGAHAPTGGYYLTFVSPGYISGPTDVPFWRWCKKCAAMAFWDESRKPGPCPAGGRHDHSESGFYYPPSFGPDVVQVVHDNLSVGQQWTDPANRTQFDVVAMDAATATVAVTFPHLHTGLGPAHAR
jgi:hypothetical protein